MVVMGSLNLTYDTTTSHTHTHETISYSFDGLTEFWYGAPCTHKPFLYFDDETQYHPKA